MKNFLLGAILMLFAFLLGRYFEVAPTDTSTAEAAQRLVKSEATTSPTAMPAPTSANPDSGSGEQAYTDQELHTIRLFESSSKSVCYITTSSLRRDWFSLNVTEIPSGSGSGFVWDENGHIITNYHVIKGASKAMVALADGSSYEATLVGKAPEKDLAVLQIDAPKNLLQRIPLGASDNLRVGQQVFAIGNPFGLDQTLTTGIVSALNREINSVAGVPIRGVIQTDAAINPGNSGGPLLDSKGQLIGVNTAIYSPSGASAGIGFSIPVDVVRHVVPDLIKYGQVRRPTLAVEFTRPLRNVEGIAIYSTEKGGAADRAGLKGISRDASGALVLGDILVAINGRPIKNANDLYLELERYEPGETVEIAHIRDGKNLVTSVKLDSSVQ